MERPRIGTDIEGAFSNGRHELPQIGAACIVEDLARRIMVLQGLPFGDVVAAA